MSNIRIAGIVENSITDGIGIRFSIFTQGCFHNCAGCHNPHTHDINGGKIVTVDSLYNQIISDKLLQGVTFTGGEPLLQSEGLTELAEKIKNYTDLDITIFSGYTYEEITSNEKYFNLLKLCDYLIDGRFDIDKKDYTLYMRGSSNQRFIDLNETFKTGEICLYHQELEIY